jgi:1-aminocyclopropane-1-carboxylate deaminase
MPASIASGRLADLLTLCSSAPVTSLPDDPDVDVLRLDAIHPLLSGNKLFKLIDYLDDGFLASGKGLVSVGGVYSNHLHALAALGRYLNIPVYGLVRGYESEDRTPTLADCEQMGMRLFFLDRKTYARRYETDWQQQWTTQLQARWIGEGGARQYQTGDVLAQRGGALLAQYCQGYDEVWLASGSATTAHLLMLHLPSTTRLVLVNTLADQGALAEQWQLEFGADPSQPQWSVLPAAGGGRFGRITTAVLNIIRHYDRLGLPLDPVYGARLLLTWLAQSAADKNGKRVLLIHGGGLQGRRGAGLNWSVGADVNAWLASRPEPASSVAVPQNLPVPIVPG